MILNAFMGEYKLNYYSYYINHMWLIYNIQTIWLHISRFTKQFPSNDFYKHFICFKLLVILYILLFVLHFKLIYNCVSNKCFLILKLCYQTYAFKLFYRLTSSRSSLKIIFLIQMFYKTYLCFYIINCMPLYV